MEVICYVDVYWAWISTVMMIVKTATNSIYLVKVWIEYYHYCIHSCTLIFKHVSLNFSVVDCGFEIEAMDCSSCPQFENWCNSTDCGWIDGKCEGKQHLAHYFKSIYDSGPIVLYLGSCTNHVDNYGGQWNVHFRGRTQTTWTVFWTFSTPPPPFVDSFSKKALLVKWTFHKPPPPMAVHKVCAWPLKRNF